MLAALAPSHEVNDLMAAFFPQEQKATA